MGCPPHRPAGGGRLEGGFDFRLADGANELLDSTGAIDLTVTGGVFPYVYNWSNGTALQDLANIAAGSYGVTVTDDSLCASVKNYVITEPPAFNLSLASLTNVACKGQNTGKVDVTITGGVPPYTFVWSNGPNSEDVLSLFAGVYSVTAMDNNGCSRSDTFTIAEPTTDLGTTLTKTDVTCAAGNDGTVSATSSGGTPPYSYVWNNGITDSVNAVLTAGTYAVTVSDNNGCVVIETITVGTISSIAVTETISNISCNGGSDGYIKLNVTGGIQPYTYLWSNGNNTDSTGGLSATSYSVTITDNVSCTFSKSFNLAQPDQLTLTALLSDIKCSGNSGGAIDLTVFGGTAPYTYSWSNGSSSQDLSTLGTGTYVVLVTDSNFCTVSTSFVISSPPPLNLSAQVTNADCYGTSTGQINVTLTGGLSPFAYFWSTTNGSGIVQGSQDQNALSAGTYKVVVTDSNACSDSLTLVITEPDAIGILEAIDSVSCSGGSDGDIFLTILGGNPPYTYLWSNGRTTQFILNVTAGNYQVTVTDDKGCSESASFDIGETVPLVTNMVAIDSVTCYGGTDGSVNLEVSGGTPPYSYLWSNFVASQDLNNVKAGLYIVQVSDYNGCITLDSARIDESARIEVTALVTDVSCYGLSDGSINITPAGGIFGGVSPYTYSWNGGASSSEDTLNISTGVYDLEVFDDNLCSESFSFTIDQPDSIILSAAITNIDCNGNFDGEIDLEVIGGTPAYTYLWSNGSGNEDLSVLPADTFSVVVTDDNLCVARDTFVVNESATLETDLIKTNVTCFGDGDGAIDLVVSGGTAPYSYLWSTFQFVEDLNNLSGGHYVVIVTDDKGCKKTDSVTIREPKPLYLTVIAKGAVCGGIAGGVVKADSLSGGTPPYSFLWDNGDITPSIGITTAGVFHLTVTDANGCTVSDEAQVIGFPIPSPAFEVENEPICQSDPIQFINISTIAQPGIIERYFWKFKDGDTSALEEPVHLYSDPGSYEVTLVAISNKGCQDSAKVIINVAPTPDATITSARESNTICANDPLLLSVFPDEDHYEWSTEETDMASIFVTETGVVSVTVTNTAQCADTGTISVTALDPMEVTVSNDTSVSKGFTIQLFATGGDVYTWEPEDGLDDPLSDMPKATPLQNTSYIVTITDENGCVETKTVNVNVRDDFLLVPPNLFTPNGDGHNDTWRIKNILLYSGCEVSVFNRWGSEVFISKEYQNDWDGTNDGKQVADGTYYYVINCGNSVVYKGAITILR